MGLPSARGTESSAALCPKACVECWVHPTLYLVLDSLGFQFVFSSDVQPDLGWLYSVIMLDILQGEPPTRFIQYGFLRAISCFTFLLVGCRSYPEISWSQVRGQQVFSLYSVEAANFLFAGSFGPHIDWRWLKSHVNEMIRETGRFSMNDSALRKWGTLEDYRNLRGHRCWWPIRCHEWLQKHSRWQCQVAASAVLVGFAYARASFARQVSHGGFLIFLRPASTCTAYSIQ